MKRIFEILPGFLSWITLGLVVVLAWQKPAWIAVFIIIFDTYWLVKTIYLSVHLRAAFNKMRDNLKVNWFERIKNEFSGKWEDVRHLVILPMYKEPYEVIRESFASLAKANYPKDKFILVLAVEERGGEEDKKTAEKILKEFSGVFSNFIITRHPSGISGEISGKGSNETWAIKEVKNNIIDPMVNSGEISYENILVSVFDIDTQVHPEYFGCLTHNFFTCENPQRSSFQPIPIFTNNIYQAPAFARVISFSSSFWQMMQQARPERLTTFSSHSMPFKALKEIGYWQTDVVSEDSRIFWQYYIYYDGDWRTVPLFFPVYMDANVAPSFWKTLINVYKQQRRWGYGAENVSYFLEGFIKNKKISWRKKVFWSFNAIEGYHSWATNVLIIFALGWLPVLIGGGNFGYTVLAYKLPGITRAIISFSSVGIVSSAILSLLLLPQKSKGMRSRDYLWYFLQWFLMPLTLIFFGAIPALDAQTRLILGGKWKLGFWVTPKSRH